MLSAKQEASSVDRDEQRLWDLLGEIHSRVNRLAETEADAALVGGVAAKGVFQPSKGALIKRAEQIVDALERLHADRT